MADIPGLIEGAADGAGLGIRFLKHLQRTRVLLHLVDIAPVDPNADPVRDAISIVGELGKFSEDLLAKPRWLVLNKSDLMPPDEAAARAISIAQALKYRGPAFLISGVTRAGTSELTEAVMNFIESGVAPAQGNLRLPEVKAVKKAAPKKAVPKKAAKRVVPKKRAPARKKKAVLKKAATKKVASKAAAGKRKKTAPKRKK
jgi:GTP-binding protein